MPSQETWALHLQHNRVELATSIDESFDEDHSEEENNHRIVDHTDARRIRRNKSERENDSNGCMYKDFMASIPPSLSGEPKPITVMDWISEIEMVLESCGCNNRQKTVFAIGQLKTGVLS